jgi:hypothetical protein
MRRRRGGPGFFGKFVRSHSVVLAEAPADRLLSWQLRIAGFYFVLWVASQCSSFHRTADHEDEAVVDQPGEAEQQARRCCRLRTGS